jgi:hypothetical protein
VWAPRHSLEQPDLCIPLMNLNKISDSVLPICLKSPRHFDSLAFYIELLYFHGIFMQVKLHVSCGARPSKYSNFYFYLCLGIH